MIYCGKAGLWHDWIKFQAHARKERQRQIELAKNEREEMVQKSLNWFYYRCPWDLLAYDGLL